MKPTVDPFKATVDRFKTTVGPFNTIDSELQSAEDAGNDDTDNQDVKLLQVVRIRWVEEEIVPSSLCIGLGIEQTEHGA